MFILKNRVGRDWFEEKLITAQDNKRSDKFVPIKKWFSLLNGVVVTSSYVLGIEPLNFVAAT